MPEKVLSVSNKDMFTHLVMTEQPPVEFLKMYEGFFYGVRAEEFRFEIILFNAHESDRAIIYEMIFVLKENGYVER